MARYAADTKVTSEASRSEIEKTLQRYGADGFLYGWEGTRAVIGFRMHNRRVQFQLTMPDRQSDEFTHTATRGWLRDEKSAQAEWEKACRQRWRALALVVKAKLEAVDAGITSFEDEFLAATLLPNGSTVGQWAGSQIDEAYESGQMPALIPGAAPKALKAGR